MSGDLFGVGLAVVLLALNAFFVGAEFALLSARRSQIEPYAQQGSRAARTTLRAMENISLVMAGAQLGITVCSLGLGAIGEPAVAHLLEPVFHAARMPDNLLHPVSFVVAMSVVVYLHVVLGEMVPKNIALAGADRAAMVLSPPMMVIGTLLGYLHIKDALESDDDKRSRVIEDKWIRPFASVHPDDLLHDALESLQVKGAHMARVVERDGTVVGLVTLEDVLEELVGEIRDAAHHDVSAVDAR